MQRLDVKESAIHAWVRGGIHHQFNEALASGSCNGKNTRGTVCEKRCGIWIRRTNQSGLYELAEQGREGTGADLLFWADDVIGDFGDQVAM